MGLPTCLVGVDAHPLAGCATLSPMDFFSWGAAVWSTTIGPTLRYEFDAASPCYKIQAGQVRLRTGLDPTSRTWTWERDIVWELISNMTLWFIWRAPCFSVFEDRQEPPAETIWSIWLELVHTLRG